MLKHCLENMLFSPMLPVASLLDNWKGSFWRTLSLLLSLCHPLTSLFWLLFVFLLVNYRGVLSNRQATPFGQLVPHRRKLWSELIVLRTFRSQERSSWNSPNRLIYHGYSPNRFLPDWSGLHGDWEDQTQRNPPASVTHPRYSTADGRSCHNDIARFGCCMHRN